MNGPAGIVSGLDSQRLSARGIPQALTRGSQGSYLAAFLTDPRITVTAAAARAGPTAAAIRQRRSRDPVFAAAEKANARGQGHSSPMASPSRSMTPAPPAPWRPSCANACTAPPAGSAESEDRDRGRGRPTRASSTRRRIKSTART